MNKIPIYPIFYLGVGVPKTSLRSKVHFLVPHLSSLLVLGVTTIPKSLYPKPPLNIQMPSTSAAAAAAQHGSAIGGATSEASLTKHRYVCVCIGIAYSLGLRVRYTKGDYIGLYRSISCRGNMRGYYIGLYRGILFRGYIKGYHA